MWCDSGRTSLSMPGLWNYGSPALLGFASPGPDIPTDTVPGMCPRDRAASPSAFVSNEAR